MPRFFPQERRRTCAVAALRSALASQFGVRVREDVLRFAGTTANLPILREGADTSDLRRMLDVANRALNIGTPWRLRVFRQGTVRDLAREVRAGRLPLAAVRRPGTLHMVLVHGYRPGKVRYFDPDTGRSRWVGSGAFRRQWLDEEGRTWYAIVTGGDV